MAGLKRKAHNKKNLSGLRFGRLTVIEERGRKVFPCGEEKVAWLCKCDCGSTVVVLGSSLTTGNTASCGCLSTEILIAKNKTHGLSKSRTYRIWQAMLNRCRNENTPNFKNYGGRGITVCKRWDRFEKFIEDMGIAPEERSIERKNNDGNYGPDNCIWADRKAQGRNTRSNRVVSFGGESKCLIEWAEELKIDQSSLRERLEKWPIERALIEKKFLHIGGSK